MQRAGIGLLLLVMVQAGPAHADCAAEAASLQTRLASTAGAKREEARLLIEKARVDAEHGREQLCTAALQSAAKLMH